MSKRTPVADVCSEMSAEAGAAEARVLPPLSLLSQSAEIGVNLQTLEALFRDIGSGGVRIEASWDMEYANKKVVLKIYGLQSETSRYIVSQWLEQQFDAKWRFNAEAAAAPAAPLWRKIAFYNNHVCSNPSASYYEVTMQTSRGFVNAEEARANVMDGNVRDFVQHLLRNREAPAEDPFTAGVNVAQLLGVQPPGLAQSAQERRVFFEEDVGRTAPSSIVLKVRLQN